MTLFNKHKSYQNKIKILFQNTIPSKTQYQIYFNILQKLQSIIIQKTSKPIYTTTKKKTQIKLKNIQQSKKNKTKTKYINK